MQQTECGVCFENTNTTTECCKQMLCIYCWMKITEKCPFCRRKLVALIDNGSYVDMILNLLDFIIGVGMMITRSSLNAMISIMICAIINVLLYNLFSPRIGKFLSIIACAGVLIISNQIESYYV